MIDAHARNLVLAVYPSKRGLAYVFFEGPESPFDWGIKQHMGKQRNSKTIHEIKKLVERYRPEVLVIEDTVAGSRRPPRIRRLYRTLAHLAMTEFIDLHRFRKDEVLECFSSVGATTKFEIAQAIARQIPAFAHRLPPLRKAWMTQDPRQTLFDAVALALVFYRQVKFPDLDSDEMGKA